MQKLMSNSNLLLFSNYIFAREWEMATCINSAKLVSLLCFMLLLSLVHWNCRKNSNSIITKNIDSLTSIRREKRRRLLQKLDLNYVSKRRVPNGPDPIHNKYVSLFFFLPLLTMTFLICVQTWRIFWNKWSIISFLLHGWSWTMLCLYIICIQYPAQLYIFSAFWSPLFFHLQESRGI